MRWNRSARPSHLRILLPVLGLGLLSFGNTTSSADTADISYRIYDVPGADKTFCTGINDAGRIVGDFSDASGANTHGFLLSRDLSTVTQLDVPDSTFTATRAINNHGDIVGTFFGVGTPTQGFLLSHGTFTRSNGQVRTSRTSLASTTRGTSSGMLRDLVPRGTPFYSDVASSRRLIRRSVPPASR